MWTVYSLWCNIHWWSFLATPLLHYSHMTINEYWHNKELGISHGSYMTLEKFLCLTTNLHWTNQCQVPWDALNRKPHKSISWKWTLLTKHSWDAELQWNSTHMFGGLLQVGCQSFIFLSFDLIYLDNTIHSCTIAAYVLAKFSLSTHGLQSWQKVQTLAQSKTDK